MTSLPPFPPPPPPPPPSVDPLPVPPGPEPAEIGTLRVFFIVSLVVNSVATLWWLATTLGVGLATCGIGCFLVVLPVVSIIAIVLDAMALQKLAIPGAATESFLRTAAIFDIISGAISMSVVPLVMGILSLVHLQKPEVQAFYRR